MDALQHPLTLKDVLLIVEGEHLRSELRVQLAAARITKVTVADISEALRVIDITAVTFRLICLSTNGMDKRLAHDSQHLLDITLPLRNKLGNLPLLVLDGCDSARHIRVIDGITAVHSPDNAVEAITGLLREMQPTGSNDKIRAP